MTGPLALHAIAQTSAIRIVDCLVEGTLIALCAGLMLRFWSRKSSAVRFGLWFSALMAIAVLPFSRLRWLSGLSAPLPSTAPLTLPSSWALYVFGAWAGIAAWHLLRVAIGLWQMHSLRHSCVPVDSAALDPRLRRALDNGRGTAPVRLCTSDRIEVPTAIGLVSPLIIVPHWVMDDLSPDELHQILLHELAHLRRWDDWTNLAQKLVRALLFFHPAVWWIEKKVSLEREMACDDAVLAETARPRAYAECLTHLAEKTLVRRSLALAQAALGRVRQTSLRVAQILDANRPRSSTHVWRSSMPLVAGFAVACAVLATKEPQLIAFRDARPNPGASAMAASVNPALPPVAAAFEVAGASPSRVVRKKHAPVTALAKSNNSSKPAGGGFEGVETAFMVESSTFEPNLVHTNLVHTNLVDTNLVHATVFNSTSLISTETLYVVVEQSSVRTARQPLYEIRIWRVTVFHPANRSASRETPRKET